MHPPEKITLLVGDEDKRFIEKRKKFTYMENEGKNYLGIDWGTSKIGVALAHAETRLALAYTTLKNDELFMTQLKNIIEEENIGTIVIGIPHHEKRGTEPFEQEAFGELLKNHFSVEVTYHDEMFTTKMAHSAMLAQGEKSVSTHDDAESARILLQSYLEKKKSSFVKAI